MIIWYFIGKPLFCAVGFINNGLTISNSNVVAEYKAVGKAVESLLCQLDNGDYYPCKSLLLYSNITYIHTLKFLQIPWSTRIRHVSSHTDNLYCVLVSMVSNLEALEPLLITFNDDKWGCIRFLGLWFLKPKKLNL